MQDYLFTWSGSDKIGSAVNVTQYVKCSIGSSHSKLNLDLSKRDSQILHTKLERVS